MALKIGLVGMGGIGNTHASCYMEDDLANLVAVCDWVKEKADAAAEKYGVKAYYSLQDMLAAHPDLDIVDVTTSGYENGSWHFVPTIEALNAGKNVLVEKPISNDIREAREMVRLAAEKDVYLGCDLNHYFTQTAYKADQFIKDGKLGQPVYILQKMALTAVKRPMEASPPPVADSILPCKGLLVPSLLPHASLWRRHHPHPVFYDQAWRPCHGGRPDVLHQLHQLPLCQRLGGISAEPAGRRHLWSGRLVEL